MVTGSSPGWAQFVADVGRPGMLEAAVLRSRHAHARIVSIDATRALALPGVRAVLTAADVPETAIIPNRVGGARRGPSNTYSPRSRAASSATWESPSPSCWPTIGISRRTRWP